MACKCANVQLAEFLLNFFQIDINKSSVTFLKENSVSSSRVAHIKKLQIEFSMITTNFIAFIKITARNKIGKFKIIYSRRKAILNPILQFSYNKSPFF